MQKIIKKKIVWLLMVVFLSAPFITNAALTITTNAATSITNTGATLNATVAIFQQNATVKFRYTLTSPGTSPSCNTLTNYLETSSQSFNYAGSSNGGAFPFTRNIAGLIQGTTYYFCALDQGNGVYGSVLSFTTTGTTPSGGGGGSNASLSSSGVTQTGATLIATNITSPAGSNGPSESVYFRYTSGSSNSCSGMTNYQSSPSASAGPTNNWSVSVPISGLSAGTTYRFCLVITPNANVGNQFLYSDLVTFQTLPNPSGSGSTPICGANGNPTIGHVETYKAINITDTQATLHGSVANLSCTIYGYFRYSSLAIPPIFCNDIFGSAMRSVTATVPNASGQIQAGDFYGVAKNLKPDTVYYYCAVASNNAFNPTEIDHGDVESFKTLPCATCDKTKITTKKPAVTGNSKATLYGSYSSTKTVKTYFEYRKHIVQAVTTGTSPTGTNTSTPATNLSWTKVDEKTHTPIAGYTTYGNMSYSLSGLQPDTYYKVRAVGETNNPAETFYGDVLTFKTLKYNGVGPIPTNPGSGFCPPGTTGTPPNCVNISVPGGPCPAGSIGTYPNCVDINDPTNPNDDTCPVGWTGTPPNCVDTTVSTPTCPVGSTGVYPNCVVPNGPGPNDDTCPIGWIGTPPNCVDLGGPGGGGPLPTDPGDDGNPGDDNPTLPTCGPGTNDIDCDGIPNWNDNDDDGDGVPDTTDPTPNGPGTPNDTDGDGLPDNNDPDVDGDGIPNGQDTDIDGDGIPNNNDSDMDGDGIPNVIDSDTDGDGIPNSTDTDDDNDGIPDVVDSTPTGPGTPNDYDGGGIPNGQDSDMDGDGIPNVIDSDTDGDGIPNDVDTDDDNDGIPDVVDSTPTGMGTPDDYDGDGIPNGQDSDMDGDGIPNVNDSDVDGDGTPNSQDPDIDNDGIPNAEDDSPYGFGSNRNTVIIPLAIGSRLSPEYDDIVRYHEGIEHVFIRRIIRSTGLQNRYGYIQGTNLQQFAYDLAHTLAKAFGYVDGKGREIRVSKPDVSAYALRLSGNKLTVYEYYNNVIVDIRRINSPFKNKNPYEYYFRK